MTEGKYIRIDLGDDGTPRLHWPDGMSAEDARRLVILAWGLLEDVKTGDAFDSPMEEIGSGEGC